jgi:hypothetical protein
MRAWITYGYSFLLLLLGVCAIIDSFTISSSRPAMSQEVAGGLSAALFLSGMLGVSVATSLRRLSGQIRQLEQRVRELEQSRRETADATPATQRRDSTHP